MVGNVLMNEYRQPAVPHAREIQVIFLLYLRQFVCKSISLVSSYSHFEKNLAWAVVEAHQVEWSLPTPDVCSSSPVIGKFYIGILSTKLKRQK